MARNPIIPGTPRDRTGTTRILRRAYAEIDRRFAGLTARVVELFKAIRTIEVNEVRPVLYALTPEQMQALSAELQAALDYWIASGRDPAHQLWYSPYVAETYQLGSAMTAANLANLSAAYAATRPLSAIINSEPYRNRVGMAQIKSYEHWVGQGPQIRSELAQIIGSAVADGKNPRDVVTLLQTRLDVSRAKARQFAQTDITDSLRQARWAERDQAESQYGIRIGLLWTSALLPTTRQTHAARHGKVYTSQECRAFYGPDKNGHRSNIFNCHCATTETLLDDKDNPILTDRLKKSMAKEKADWTPS